MPLLILAAASTFAADLSTTVDLHVGETAHGPHRGARAHQHAEAREPAGDRHLSVVATMDLPTPLPAASMELALTRRFSISGRLGLGAADTLALYDVGGGLRGYLFGDFDGGLFVGAGVGRTNFTPASFGLTSYTLDASVGGKYTHAIGFTLEGAAGVEVYTLRDTGVVSPTAHLGVGWSF